MKRYIRASFSSSIPDWLTKDKGAIEALNQAGVDLHSATFSSEKTGKMGDNYVIYLINGTKDDDELKPFVWIPGVYNDYYLVCQHAKYVKYVPKKDLNIIDTVYVYKSTNMKAPREHYRDPRYEYDVWSDEARSRVKSRYAGQYYEDGQWNVRPGRWRANYGNGKRDKSGYEIPYPEDRLKEFYSTEAGRNKRVKTLRAKLDNIYKQLETVKDNIYNSIRSKGNPEDYNQYTYLYKTLGFAITCYDDAINYLKRYDEDKADWRLDKASNKLKDAQGFIDDINKSLG